MAKKQPSYKDHCDIRIGTLVNGLGKNPAAYIEEILPYGFESFGINFWQTTKGVNFKKLAADVKTVLKGTDAIVSHLGIFGNPLEKGALDKETLQGWKNCINNVHHFDTNLVAGFTGRVRGKSIPDSIPAFKRVFGSLTKLAAKKDVNIAFENCDMGGTWQTGDWNIAHSPDAWELMFDAVPTDNIGLQWEPCHQMVSLIDPMPQLKAWVHKIFNVHGKDATVDWDVVKTNGVHGPKPFAYHRTPGFGDSNWTDIITILRQNGYRGSIDIEGWHDPVYRGELEMTGQVHGLNYLKQCRGSEFVPNPKNG